jgi:hypothetical protein
LSLKQPLGTLRQHFALIFYSAACPDLDLNDRTKRFRTKRLRIRQLKLEDTLVSNPHSAAETAINPEHDAQAAGDARTDAKAILILIATAIAIAIHFVSGWAPDI